MATIRIDVSDETLAAIERERAARGETQSEFVARALNGFLERKRDAFLCLSERRSRLDCTAAMLCAYRSGIRITGIK